MSELCINIAKIKNEPQGIRDYMECIKIKLENCHQ